jgi:RND family efflux transporter MFP subunit
MSSFSTVVHTPGVDRRRPALLLAVAIGLTGCIADPAAQPPGAAGDIARPVVVAHPIRDQSLAVIRATGRTEAADELALSFKVGGVIEQVTANAGDRVRAGQMLARLDRTEAAAGAERAAQALAKAERDLARAEELASRRLIARRERDDAETAREVAAATLRAARFDLAYATITAPADGRIKQRLARAGEIVAAGQPVLTLAAEGRGWVVKAALADREALRLEVGDPAEATADARPGERFAARVARIGGAADPATGTVEVEFAVEDPGGRLLSGLVTRIEARPAGTALALAIPVAALVRADGAVGEVRLVERDRAVAREVVLGPIAGERVLVHDGLAPGDQVIVAGAAWVDPGAAVRIVPR